MEYVSLPATPETANAESFIKMRERYDDWVKGLRAKAHVEVRQS